MTLVEFLSPVRDAPHRERVLAVLYYKDRYEGESALTVEQVRVALKNARAPGWSKVNVPDVLLRSAHLVDTPGTVGSKRLWSLTTTGLEHVRQKLGLPVADVEVEHDVGTLEQVARTIIETEIRDYVNEAVLCLKAGALRASVVFLWSGTVREIQTRLLTHPVAALNASLKRHDPKARDVTKLDHFAYIKDSHTLLAAQDLGILDKNERETLEEALDLRNRSGHPGKYKPGPKKVSSFIEDIVSIVF
jgi:hypothetical protein